MIEEKNIMIKEKMKIISLNKNMINKWLNDNLGRLRLVGFCEAFSWLLLLGFAMPLKYIWKEELAVKIVGWVHGYFFIVYIFLAIRVKFQHNWKWNKLINAFISALVPFGTFFFDAQLKKEQSQIKS